MSPSTVFAVFYVTLLALSFPAILIAVTNNVYQLNVRLSLRNYWHTTKNIVPLLRLLHRTYKNS